MAWMTVISQLLGHVAWPATLVAFIIIFRREIRHRLSSVTKVEYPGGSVTMREVERLEAQVEDVFAVSASPRQKVGQPLGVPQALHSDSRLAIAQMRLDAERELFLASRLALRNADSADWTVRRHIDELEKAKVIVPPLVDSLRDFVSLAERILHGASLPDALALRAAAVGSSVVATLRHKRLVLEAEYDMDGDLIWHMHTGDNKTKYHVWAAVASSLPDLHYNYDVYREAAEQHNKKVTSVDCLPILTLEEFIVVLEARERELLRIIRLWTAGKTWARDDEQVEWQWPTEWGDIGWSCPILNEHVHLWGAEEDLMRTRAALAGYRTCLLTNRRLGPT